MYIIGKCVFALNVIKLCTGSLHLEGLENDLMNWLSGSLSVSTTGPSPNIGGLR